MLKAFLTHRQAYFSSKITTEETDVLFVSHLLNSSMAGRDLDFYYGDLPNQLVQRGRKAVIALINYSNASPEKLAKEWAPASVPRMVLSRTLSVKQETGIRRRLMGERNSLQWQAQAEATGLFRSILERAALDTRSGGALHALRLGEQIGSLVTKLKPKVLVVTHEGHAWERVAFSAARRALPGIRCIGYQHAALFRLQHAIRRKLGNEFNPDVILTAGTASKAELERTPGLYGVSVAVLGSNRSFKRTSTAHGTGEVAANRNERGTSSCLVLPEGFESECRILFRYALACAMALPEIRFIWRLHPSVTYRTLARKHPELFKNLPANIELSHASLEEDLSQSRWVLYRGSTAAVQAAVAGLRPVYLKQNGEMTIDPLYALNDWRAVVSTVHDFRGVISARMEADEMRSKSTITEAMQYCESLFTPLDVDVMTAQL